LGGHNIKSPPEEEPARMIVNVTKADIFQHPNYDPDTISHDISILRLPEKLTFSGM